MTVIYSHFGEPDPPLYIGLDIVDQAYNPLLQPATAQMMGYTEVTVAEVVDPNPLFLQIYLFLIETIRIEDAINGELFLKRFLEGPQAVWAQIKHNIFSVPDLWSIVNIPDEYLQYLKRIVGWTSDLDHITDALSYDQLRRLISSSISIWKIRGTQTSITSLLSSITGARLRIWDWFDFRWISDETGFGHESDGYDPWLISIDNDHEFNIRIVDDGELDRELVVNLLKLMRPIGERIEVTYLHLLDLFSTDEDDEQWDAIDDLGQTGTTVLTVADGTAVMDDTARREEMYANVIGSALWDQFVYSARIRGSGLFGITFYRQSTNSHYMFRLDTTGATDDFDLVRRLGGIDSIIATSSPPSGFLVDPLAYYMFRVQITREGSTNRILCFIDGYELINTTNSQFSNGTVGILHDTGGTVEVDEVEVLGLPANTDFIDINS
jgi:phage tail-like protein